MKAAIDIIRSRSTQMDWYSDKERGSLIKVLAVLEAAEKVDKNKILRFLDEILNPLHDDFVYDVKRQLRALLESLPDAKE